MNDVTTTVGQAITNPIVIPGIRRATITMVSEQYRIPYDRLANAIHNHKDLYDIAYPKSKEEFESSLADNIQFVCKADRSGNVGYLFTNAAFANIKFGRTPLISARDIPKLVQWCGEEHRGRKKKMNEEDMSNTKSNTDILQQNCDKVAAEINKKAEKDGVVVLKDMPNPLTIPIPEEPKTDIFDSNEEETLLLNFAKAFKSGEIMNLMTAALALDSYRQREIAALKANDAENNYISWTSPLSAEKVVGVLSTALQETKYQTWCRIYDVLMNDHGIDLRVRAKRPLVNGLKESEWHLLYQAMSDICKSKYIDLRLVLADAGINTTGLSVMVKL